MGLNHTSPVPGKANSAADWEPALSQLRYLSADRLEELIRSWLGETEFTMLGISEAASGSTTFRARIRSRLLPVAVTIRVYQRRSRLQTHHVDAFAGHLLRTGSPMGILIGTGDCAEAAVNVAASYRSPNIRLFSGSQWLAELKSRRVGLKRKSFWNWVLAPSQGTWHIPPRGDERGMR